jgi:hypothetical protein
MKKTKYSEGGLTGNVRGNKHSGIDYTLNTDNVSVSGRGKGDSRNLARDEQDKTGMDNRSKSITVHNKDKSASYSESPHGKQYGLTTNGVRVNINKGNWGDKSASVSKGNWSASAGKDSQGKTNASVTFSKRF